MNLINKTFLYLYPVTHCVFVSNIIANLRTRTLTVADFKKSNRKFNVSLDRTLLFRTTNPFTFHCRNLKCQTTGGQKISTSGFHFRRPGRQRSRCLRSLLHWVSEKYVSLFKLWTVYSWLTFQFSTGPDLKCMAAS